MTPRMRGTIGVFFLLMVSAGVAVGSSFPPANSSGVLSSGSLSPYVVDLLASNVSLALSNLGRLLELPPLKDITRNSFLKGPDLQSHLFQLLLVKMEAEKEQLRAKISDLEEEKGLIKQQISEWRKGPHTKQIETQKSTPPYYNAEWPRDCSDIMERGDNKSGIYTIYPQKCGAVSGAVRVRCDLESEGGGWTVILQRRPLGGILDPVDFNLGWRLYRLGFGNPETEYWIGNDNLHRLTAGITQMLRVEMTDWDNESRYAEYRYFHVENADGEYRLHVGGYSGNAGDSLAYHNGMLFSTPGRDNDASGTDCATTRKSGFWFNGCEHAGPTNPLLPKQNSQYGVHWYKWRNSFTTLKKMSFKLKPAACLPD